MLVQPDLGCLRCLCRNIRVKAFTRRVVGPRGRLASSRCAGSVDWVLAFFVTFPAIHAFQNPSSEDMRTILKLVQPLDLVSQLFQKRNRRV
jgi:hypothetical protein